MKIKKLTGCVEITLSENDFLMLNRVVKSIQSEYNPQRHGADIYLEDEEIDFIKRLFSKMPEEE